MANNPQSLFLTQDPTLCVARMQGLLQHHHELLISYAKRHIPVDLHRLIDPADAVQEASLDCFRRLNDLAARDDDEARRWILTILRHCLINLITALRAAKRGGKVHFETPWQAEGVTTLLADLAMHERTPSQSAMRHEVAARLRLAIAALSPDHARVIEMRYLKGRTIAETAKSMQRSEGAVLMLCSRALSALRTQLLNSFSSV
jgi:RNA polymerase sigma factor (sigma-70 family)